MSDLGNKTIMANNIKRFLKLKGVTRKQLCAELEVPYTTVCDWVNGKIYPRIDKIEMMANYFGVEKADLVESENTVQQYKQMPADVATVAKSMINNPKLLELNKKALRLKPQDLDQVIRIVDTFVQKE